MGIEEILDCESELNVANNGVAETFTDLPIDIT